MIGEKGATIILEDLKQKVRASEELKKNLPRDKKKKQKEEL
jgi:DNA-binding HxlR family transcriptional regulator